MHDARRASLALDDCFLDPGVRRLGKVFERLEGVQRVVAAYAHKAYITQCGWFTDTLPHTGSSARVDDKEFYQRPEQDRATDGIHLFHGKLLSLQ